MSSTLGAKQVAEAVITAALTAAAAELVTWLFDRLRKREPKPKDEKPK